MLPRNGQIVIYGKEGHAEVNALKGQTSGTAIVIGSEDDLSKIDLLPPCENLQSDHKSVDGFRQIVTIIRNGWKR